MYKKVILLALFSLAVPLASPRDLYAEEEVCTQSYGQPVVCGVKTPEQEIVVKAGFEEDLRLVGFTFVVASALLFAYSKKAKRALPIVEY